MARQRRQFGGKAMLVLAALTVLLGTACRSSQRQLFAPQAMMAELFLRVQEVEVDDRRVRVKMTIENHSTAMVRIDRGGFALRLPNGRILVPLNKGELYEVGRGDEQRVDLDFASDDQVRASDYASLIIGGIRFGNDPYMRAIGELPLSYDPGIARQQLAALPAPMPQPAPTPPPRPPPTPTPVSAPPAAAGPAASQATSVSVDVTTLDDATFKRLDGVALEKQIVVRLVQDGFAVVAPTWQPAVVLTVHGLGQSILLQAYGAGGMHKREVAAEVGGKQVPAAELRLELVQKAAELVRAALSPAPDARTRSL